jgi:hypothetical protein
VGSGGCVGVDDGDFVGDGDGVFVGSTSIVERAILLQETRLPAAVKAIICKALRRDIYLVIKFFSLNISHHNGFCVYGFCIK